MHKKKISQLLLAASIFLGGCSPIVIKDPNKSGTEQNDGADKSTVDRDTTKDRNTTRNTNGPIGVEDAKEIALAHAGVDEGNVYFRVVKQYNNICKLVFDDGNSVYVYKVNLNSGEIMLSKQNGKNGGYYGGNYYNNNNGSSDRSANGETISAEEATQIIFDHLGIDESKVYKLDVDFHQYRSYDPKYEIEFKYQGLEYECEVNAYTGDILEIDIDD